MNILMVLTNRTKLGETDKKTGYFLKEVAYPYYILKRAGHKIDFCSPSGFRVTPDPISLNYDKDEIIIKFFKNNEMQKKLSSTIHPRNIVSSDYSGIIFIGGHGSIWDFPKNINLQNLTREIYENLGLVGAICHGSAIFANLKLSNGNYLISGKKVSCFSNEEERQLQNENIVPFLLETKLKSLGAVYSKAENFEPHVEKDNRLITAQNASSSEKFGEALLERLKYLN